MSYRLRYNFLSPSNALLILAFAQTLEAQSTDQSTNLSSTQANEAVMSIVRDLTKLMADRLELAEKVARHKWNERISDDKLDLSINESNLQIIKESGVELVLAEAFVKDLAAVVKEHQKQRVAAWVKEGVYEFDDVPDALSVVKPLLDKNLREQLDKLNKLTAVLCTNRMLEQVNDMAAKTFVRRDIDRNLAKATFEHLCVTSPVVASPAR